MNEFREEMLRRFTPYFKYNAFTKEDIDDINNVIEYARGLVIFDKKIADQYETIQSLKQASNFLKAINGTYSNRENVTEFERSLIIKNYEELNPYYVQLKSLYNISYEQSRQASDYKILKATINPLDKIHKNMFDEMYYESVNYLQKVTYTDAFINQKYNREFYREFIIFMTIQRYINKSMEDYFNIDTYDKRRLKNGFISYGLDYFDDVPLNYQRRIYKMLNTLIKNKGSNNVFQYILDIFSFENVNIYRYPLAKTSNNDLLFYKVPVNEILNLNADTPINFDYIVEKDPYWRTEKETILGYNFNVIDSKYLSVDVITDILGNSMQMAYFFSLLNYCELINNPLVTQYAKDNNITYEKALEVSGIQDIDFVFTNRNISSKPIRIYNAIIALLVLVLKRMGYSDKINQGNLNHVYAFNNLESNDDGSKITINDEEIDIPSTNKLLFEIKKYLYWNKNKINKNKWKNLLKFLNDFKLKNFKYDIELTFEEILRTYKSSIVYKNQLQYIAYSIKNVTGSTILIDKLKDELVYDAFDCLYKFLLKDKIDGSYLSPYKEFKELFSKFISFKIANGEVDSSEFLDLLLNNETILNELESYCKKLDSEVLLNKYEIFIKTKTSDNFDILVNEIYNTIVKLKEDDEYTIDKYLSNYMNLCTYLDLFYSYDKFEKSRFTMEDFAKIFRYNETLREQLKEFIIEADEYSLYKYYNQIYHNKFVGNIENKLFEGYSTYTDYLKDKDPGLYYYIQVEVTGNYSKDKERDIYRDKIFELVESIDNHLNLGNYNFLLENNFIGLADYIKMYIYILVKIFKAYTTDTIFANTIWKFNDKMENSIRLFDEFIISNTNLDFRDDLHIIDTMNMKANLKLNEEFNLSDSITIKSNE